MTVRLGIRLGICAALALALAGCTTDVGDLTIKIVRSWCDGSSPEECPNQDPFREALYVRVRVDGPDLLVGPERFRVMDKRGVLAEVPVGSDRRVTVEGLGPSENVVSRGRTGPLEIQAGENAISLYVGDLGAFSYSPTRQLLVPRAFHTATLLRDGTVVACGGVTADWRPERGDPLPTLTATMERIDGNALFVHSASPPGCQPGSTRCMTSIRAAQTASLLDDGNVLLAGGSDGKTLVERVEVFIPDEGRFIKGNALTEPRTWHGAASTRDGVLIVGGVGSGGQSLPGELYSGGNLAARPGLLEGRRGFALVALKDGTLVATGGLNQSNAPLDTIELLAPGAPSWKAAPVKMEVPRAYHTATLLADGRILLVGGVNSEVGPGKAGTATGSVERFDPVKGTIETLDKSLRPRWAHTTTLLSDGRILVVGGFSGNLYAPPSSAVDKIQFFEGDVMQVTQLAPLGEARAGHTATELKSGLVLVLGGVAASGPPSRTAEVFSP